MKKILFIISLFSLALTSCFKDDSNTDILTVNPIVIDLGSKFTNPASPSVTLFMLDTLEINPLIYKEGTPDAKLSFEWKMQGNTIVPTVIGNSMSLKAAMNFPPQSLSYKLVLTVTDKETTIQKKQVIDVTINSSFVQGVVVADTRDEKNTDLSLIASENFNSTISKDNPKIFRNVFSAINGALIDGLVKDIKTSSYGTNRSLTVITSNSILRGDHYDYKLIEHECNEGIFMLPPKKEEIRPTILDYDNVYGQDIMINNGRLYARSCQNNNRKYAFFSYAGGRFDYNASHLYSVPYHGIWLFDTIKENFMFFRYNAMTVLKDQSPTGKFDVNNFKGWVPLILGQSDANYIDFVMKNKTTGEIKDFLVNKVVDDGQNLPKDIIDLSSIEPLKHAKYYALNEMEKRLYYVTDNKLYTVSLDNLSNAVQFTPKDGETITDIQIWKGTGYVRYKNLTPDADTPFVRISSNNRAIIITTYNESTKEGKITVVPIPILNGDLEQDRDFHVEYGNFGRILKVRVQDK